MAGKDARKVDKNVKEEYRGIETELLHDDNGAQYLINDDYYHGQIDQRQNSSDRIIDLQIAKELLESNLKRLTNKQRDVIYYVMMRYTHKEIALKLDTTVASVRQHLKAVRKKLKKHITNTKKFLKEGLTNGQS